jgi:integrase
MPRLAKPLTDTQVRTAKPKDKTYTLGDGDGMYLEITPTGAKFWRMAYRQANGKPNRLTFGKYPEVSLANARDKRLAARTLLEQGIDPSQHKKESQREQNEANANTFEAVARQWLETTGRKRGEETQSRVVSWFVRDVFPFIGATPINTLRPREILSVMERMQARGIIDSMRRVLGYISKIFRFAMRYEMVDRDPTVGLSEALEQRTQRNFAAIIKPMEVGELLRKIDGYEGHHCTIAALKLAPLVFVRPGELRSAEWSEIDLDTGEWNIPGAKMKMKKDHLVPLSTQAVGLLRAVHTISGHGKYVFPGIRTSERCMSENTVNAALRGMGYSKEVMTGHGFRAMARTIMREVLKEPQDLLEHQLAHMVKDPNGNAYNRTSFLPDRRAMMQRWADYLDELKCGAKVLPFAAKTA